MTTRRDFLTLGTGLFVALSLPLAARRRLPLVRRSAPLMGTLADIQVAHRDERRAAAATDAALAELHRVETLMTRFRATSDIGRANLAASREGVPVSADTGAVVEAALEWAELSDGAFDPALGSATRLWDVLERREPPPQRSVARLAGRRLYRGVDVARHGPGAVIRFGDPDVQLDLGGIAKGFGIDRAVARLRELDIRHALVTVGGDLYALGTSPAGGPWSVGIRDPHDGGRLAATLAAEDRAITTSGDYERYFDWRGRRYHHLIDPRTAAPRRSAVHSVTVLGADCMNADAAATAAFGLGTDAARRLVRHRLADADVIALT